MADVVTAAVPIIQTFGVTLTAVMRLICDVAPKRGAGAWFLGYIYIAILHVALHDL